MKTLMYFFVMAVILLAGCAKDDTMFETPESDQDLMLKSGKPDQPGNNLKVFRYEEGGYGYILYDEQTDLTAVVGFDIRQLYSGGGLASFDVLDFQQIVKEGDEGESPRVHVLVNQDDVTVEVWKGYITYWWQYFSNEPIYSGTGHLIYTDNDANSGLNDNKYASVWGFRLNGKAINVKYRAMWKGDDPSTIEHSISIMLQSK